MLSNPATSLRLLNGIRNGHYSVADLSKEFTKDMAVKSLEFIQIFLHIFDLLVKKELEIRFKCHPYHVQNISSSIKS